MMKTILALVAGLLVAYAHGEANSPSADAPRGERPGGMGGPPRFGQRGTRPPMDPKLEAYVRDMQERIRQGMEADKAKYGEQYAKIAQDALSRLKNPPGGDMKRKEASMGGSARAGKLLSTRYPGSFAERMMISTDLLLMCYRGDVVNAEFKYLELKEDSSRKDSPTILGFEAFPTVLAFVVTNYRAKGNVKKADEFLDVLKNEYRESYLILPTHLRTPPVPVCDFIADPDKFAKLFKGGERRPPAGPVDNVQTGVPHK